MTCQDGCLHLHVDRCYESGADDMLAAVQAVIALSPDEIERIEATFQEQT